MSSFHVLGWLCLIAGLLLVRKDLQHGYDILAASGNVPEQFAKLTLQARLQWSKLEAPSLSMTLPTARWAQVVSDVGFELTRIRNTVASSLPFPAHVARKAHTKAPAPADEEAWATDAPAQAAEAQPEKVEAQPEKVEADTSNYTKIFVDINDKPTLFRYEAGSPGGSPLALATGFCKVCDLCELCVSCDTFDEMKFPICTHCSLTVHHTHSSLSPPPLPLPL
jgi:hypothetical protein